MSNTIVNIGICAPDCANFQSVFFMPARWCHKQWRNLASPLPENHKVAEGLKRILKCVPLILATLGAYLIGIVGVMTNMCSCSYTVTTTSLPEIVGSNILGEWRKDLNAQNLDSVELRALGSLVITRGEEDSLSATADDNIVHLLKSRVEGTKLFLYMESDKSIHTSNPISYRLIVPYNPSSLIVSGSGTIVIDHVNIDNATPFSCRINGQGDICVEAGNVVNQKVVISGQGSYKASKLKTAHTTVVISGQGDAEVQATETLHATVSGQGDCTYSGNPKRVTTRISGQGSVVPR